MARDTSVHQQTDGTDANQFPNLVTIVGCGVPSNFEIAVDGEIEMLADDPASETTLISSGAVEGTIDVGVRRFRFSGELANIRVVDWDGTPTLQSSSTPTIHVEYGALEG